MKQPAPAAAPEPSAAAARTQFEKPGNPAAAAPAAPNAPAGGPPIKPSGFFGGAAARDGAGAAGRASVPNPARASANDATIAPVGEPAPRISNPALSPEPVAAPPAHEGVAAPSAPTLANAQGAAGAGTGAAQPNAPTLAPAAPGPASPAPAAPAAAEASGPAPRPPYLASETGVRMNAPVEPWATALRPLMIGIGAFLLACFAAPWSVGDTVSFSWDRLASSESTAARLIPLLLAASGVVSVLIALLPVNTSGRGLAAAAVGAIAIVAATAAGPGPWPGSAEALGLIALVAGLVLRSQYKSSLVARLLVSGGALMIAVVWLVPEAGDVPIAAAFRILGSDVATGAKLIAIGELIAIGMAALCLLAWLPAPSSAGAGALAWVVVGLAPAQALLALVARQESLGRIGVDLFGALLFPFVAAAWIALGGWGAAALLGKTLESP